MTIHPRTKWQTSTFRDDTWIQNLSRKATVNRRTFQGKAGTLDNSFVTEIRKVRSQKDSLIAICTWRGGPALVTTPKLAPSKYVPGGPKLELFQRLKHSVRNWRTSRSVIRLSLRNDTSTLLAPS